MKAKNEPQPPLKLSPLRIYLVIRIISQLADANHMSLLLDDDDSNDCVPGLHRFID